MARPSELRSRISKKSKQQVDLKFEKLERRDLLAVQPFQTPIEAVAPSGSLVYESSGAATIDTTGEIETFTIDLDAGQTVSLLVTPGSSLESQVTFKAPDATVLATDLSAAPGAPALIQTAPVAVSGVYSVEVTGQNSTTGDFTVGLTLNSALENEGITGAANDSFATAEDILLSSISIGNGSASRLAVAGHLNSAGNVGVLFSDSFDTTTFDSSRWSRVVTAQIDAVGINEPSPPYSARLDGQGDIIESVAIDLTGTTSGTISYSFQQTGGGETVDTGDDLFLEYLDASNTWVQLDQQLGSGPSMSTFERATVSIPATALHSNFQFRFRSRGSGGGFDDWFVDDVELSVVSAGTADAEDWYAFNLGDGEAATLVATSTTSSVPNIEVYASDGTTLLAESRADSLGQAVRQFVDRTTDGNDTTYFARLGNASGNYSLLVTRDADFGELSNGFVAAAQDISASGSVLGQIDLVISGTGTPLNLPEDIVGNPLSLGFANDGSFSGPTLGIRWGSTEFVNFGTFLAGYTVGYNGQTFTNNLPESGPNPFPVTAEDLSSGPNHLVRISGDVQPGVSFVRFVQWADGDDFANVTTIIDNQSGATLTNLALLENIDPDPGGPPTTSNDVVASGQLVVASNVFGAMGLGSLDPTAVVSAEGFEINDPFEIINSPSDPNGDSADFGINVAFDLGDLASGAQTVNHFQIVLGTNQAEVESTFAAIASTPALPTQATEVFYDIPVSLGDSLVLSTSTPSDGPGEFVNLLDPSLELIDPTGTVVASDDNSSADGRNSRINHTATMTGLYTVRVTGAADTSGEFVLEATGFTGTPTPFTVSGSSVVDGDRFPPNTLTDVTFDLDGHLRLDTVDTSDLLINGVANATAVTVVDADTLRFDLPTLVDGNNTFSLPAGAVTDLQGHPLEAFAVSVVVDQSGPRVINASVLEGDILPPGSQAFSVTFDEPLNQTVLNTSDLQLIGTRTGNQSLSNLLFDTATNTLTFDSANLAEDLYTLRLISGTNAFVDILGNPLDGEADPTTTVPSGDGNPGGDFLVNFEVDTALLPLPAFTPVDPLGSLIYEAAASGFIGSATDIDDFTVELDADQTLSLQVQGPIQARLTLLAPDASVLGTVDAAAAGAEVSLSAIPVATAGTYTIQVSDLAGTPGDFTLHATLNAQLESENVGGPTNDVPNDAETLIFAPITSTSPAQRAAVRGFVSNIGPTFTDSQTVSDTIFSPNVINFDFTSTPAPVGDATLTFTAFADLDSSSEFLAVNAEGIFSQNIFVSGGRQQSTVSTQITLPLATISALAVDGTISLTVSPSPGVNDLGPNQLTVDIEYPTASAVGDDWYRISLDDQQAASFTLSGNNINLELYDSDQTTLLAKGYAQSELDQVIENFVDQTTDGASQDYFIRVVAGNGDYQFVATRDASFDIEDNDQQHDGQDLTGSKGALGYVEGGSAGQNADRDWYSVSALAGDVIDVSIFHPASGPGEFENALADGIPGGIIISEVVDGAAGDGNPKFIEITNTTNTPFTFAAGGIIVQTNNSNDRNVDIDLTGVTLAAGQSYVVASSLNDGQQVFETIYGLAANDYADEVLGDGNDRYALTDSADGSSLLDVYGILDVNGIGQAWEYTDGYATRLPSFIASNGDTFDASQWVISGVDGLDDGVSTPEALLQSLTTPGSHDFIPADTPLGRVALFDAAGSLLAPDAQSLSYTVPSDGVYSIRVSALAKQGEYFVSVDGATGANLAPQVVQTDPIDGAVLTTYPTTLTVTFSETLLEGSITSSDLLINGVTAATAVSQTDLFTFTFDIDPSSNIGDGVYTFEIPAGAATDLQGINSEAFAGQFTLDATGPQVVSTTLNGSPVPVGVTILEGPVTFTATFSETLQDSLIDATDVVVSDSLSGATIVPDTFNYDSATNVLTLDFASLVEGVYEIRLLSNTSSFVDLAGNLLDGEPLGGGVDGTPSGDGAHGGDYDFEFQIDGVGTRATEPFTRLTPFGGLIFVSEGTLGLINQPADVDDFEFYVQQDEIVSAIVTPVDPSATLSVSVVGLAGPFTASAPGQPVAMPAISTPISGPLTYRVIGDRPTEFKLDAYLNVAPELAIGDSTISSPLAIDSTGIALADGIRYGALGESSPIPTQTIVYQEDFALGNGNFSVDNNFGRGSGLWHFSTGRQLDGLPGHSAPNSFYFGQGEDFFNGGDFDTGAPIEGALFSPLISLPVGDYAELEFNHFIDTDNFDATDVAEVAVIQGSTIIPVLSTADGTLSKNSFGSWESAVADLSDFAGSSIRLRFRFDTVTNDENSGEGWFIDDIEVRGTGASIADLDAYTVNLSGTDPVDIVFSAQRGANLRDAVVQLLDLDGSTVLATAVADPIGVDASNYDLGILGFTPASPGNYTIRVAAASAGDYTMVVTESLAFETEPNDGSAGAPARDLTEDLPALGYLDNSISSGSNALFAVDATAGDFVKLDPATGAEIQRTSLPEFPTGGPDGLAVLGSSVFYVEGSADGGSTILYELDMNTGAVIDSDTLASLGLTTSIDALAAFGGQLVAMDYISGRLYYIDTIADTAIGSVNLSVTVRGGAAGAGSRGSIFVNDFFADRIFEVDASNGATINSFNPPDGNVFGLAFVDGSLYAGDDLSGRFYRLDPSNGAVLDTFNVGFSITAMAGDDASGVAPFSLSAPGSLPGSTGEANTNLVAYQQEVAAPEAFATNKNFDLQKTSPLVSAMGLELAGLALNGLEAVTASADVGTDGITQVGAVDLLQIENDLVLIEAAASGDVNALLSDLTLRGIQAASVFGRIVSGWLPISALEDVASLATLQFARPSYQPIVNVGATTSQADVAMGTDIARTTFGVDGTGITIGILSDTFDGGPGSLASDIFSGDLPGPGNPNGFTTPVNILSDGFGSDEGRAMAQLIHDVAPGADLAFHTAINGQADFANGILELQSVAGADVIVDDIIYFAEPMFQDGIIAQAIDTVVANGAAYYSSAGNNARDSWEDSYRPSGTFVLGTELHDFDAGPGVDTMQSVTVPRGASVRLSFQWDSPFFSVSGGAGTPNDLDIFVYDSTGANIIASATTNNMGGDALEVFNFTNRTASSQLNIAIGLDGGPAPGLMKWVAFDTITPNEYATNSPTAYGHANAAGASAVGAARYQDTPPFGTSPPIVEPFSSAGGIPILFDTSGLPVNDLRAKPNIVAPDGTNTTFFGSDTDGDGFPNFFGTSAAAPHAAALAGLMLELNPLATPAEIYAAMESTAIDMDDPSTVGFDVGFDSGTGHGLVDANAALTLIQADPALVGPRVVSITPAAGTTNDLNITSLMVEFSETLDATSATDSANYLLIEAGPNGMFENGGGDDTTVAITPALVSPTSVALTVDDGTEPLVVGNYRLILEGDTSITDVDGNPLNSTTGPGGGSDTTHEFNVVFELPRGGDTYRFTGEVGDVITLTTSTVLADPLASPLNDLDPQLLVYGPGGNLISMDQNSADGLNAQLSFTVTVDGVYVVQVAAETGVGEYLLSLERDTILLSADFNRDSAVTGADFLAWQRGFGKTAATRSDGDANDNGVVDHGDLALWLDQYGSSADLNIVNPDLALWLNQHGTTADPTTVGGSASSASVTNRVVTAHEDSDSQLAATSFEVDTSASTSSTASTIDPTLADAALAFESTKLRDEEDTFSIDDGHPEVVSNEAIRRFDAARWELGAEEEASLARDVLEDEAFDYEWLDDELLEKVFS